MRDPCVVCSTTDGKWRLKQMCEKCYRKWYYQQNKNKIIDRSEKWRKEHPEHYKKTRRAISRRKRASKTESEKRAIDRREWQKRSRNMTSEEREKRRQRSKAWYESHKNSEQRRISMANAKSRRRLTEAKGKITAIEWNNILEKFNYLCAYCGSDSEIQMDHVVPIKLGGTHTASNIVPACKKCNRSKGARLLVDWYYSSH